MKNSIKYVWSCILCFALGLGLMFLVDHFVLSNNIEFISSSQFGGAVPMQIYTVYDKDTGVYYAVTEKGGICVMETMDGSTKLVDEGDSTVIHKNQGLNE